MILYDDINKSWPKDMAAPSPKEAIEGAKRLYKMAMGKPWRGPVKLTSGNRYTWISYGTLVVNPNRRGPFSGWEDIVHNMAHACHRRLYPGEASHSENQEVLEHDMMQFVLQNKWHEGALKRKTKPKPKRDLVKERYQKILAREKAWAKKFSRAEKALKKVVRERRQYEKRHGDRVAST